MGGVARNAAFDWGVVVNPKDGLAYVNDFNNGLWVVRVDPKKAAGPLTHEPARAGTAPARPGRGVRAGRSRHPRRTGAGTHRGHGTHRAGPRLPCVRRQRGKRPDLARPIRPVRRPGRARTADRHQPQRACRAARPLRLARREVVLRLHRARHAQRSSLEVLDRDRRAGRPRRAGTVPGDGPDRARRPLRLGGELQSLWRHGALVGIGGLHRRHASRCARIPTCIMPHGSRLSPDGHRAVLRLHDERRAGRD